MQRLIALADQIRYRIESLDRLMHAICNAALALLFSQRMTCSTLDIK
jgi:hypothetical protein